MQQLHLLQMIESGHPPVIVDVRSRYEYRKGHVPGAIHIPFWRCFGSDFVHGLKKDRPLVLYCEHGPRAGLARLGLRLAGFEDVSYLSGHMLAWKKAGLMIEK